MDNLTVVVPFFNGHQTLARLLDGLPDDIPVVIVDDKSDEPLKDQGRPNTVVLRPPRKGYFTGAVNEAIRSTSTDVLVLNQDSWFKDIRPFLAVIAKRRNEFALIGEGITGNHPAWPEGYVHGTCMFMRRDAIEKVGLMNDVDYPLWGSTCEWQLRICRQGFKALPMDKVPGFYHDRGPKERFGSSIQTILQREPKKRDWLIRTPPAISIIVPTYNQGSYLSDAISSLIGGPTSLGDMPGQSFQSFEIIIVDDASRDNTEEVGRSLADPWKGIRYMRLPDAVHKDGMPNNGTPVANNKGIEQSFGQFVTILCGDDMMEPWRLEGMYRTALKNPGHFVYDNMTRFKDGARFKLKGTDKIETFKMAPTFNLCQIRFKNTVHAGILFPKSAWKKAGGYPEAMRYGREDWAFNVALGRIGCCGVHVDPDGRGGYLYRREGQNRSLRNTNIEWHKRFSIQIQGLFPDVYEKEEDDLMCCGGRNIAPSPRGAGGSKRGDSMAMVPGEQGMLTIEYIGGNAGNQQWVGSYTKTVYVFGGGRKVGRIDTRDWPGMEKIYDGNRKAFKRYKSPATTITVDPGEAAEINKMPEPELKPEPVGVLVAEESEAVEEIISPSLSGQDPGKLSVKALQETLIDQDLPTLKWMLELEKEGQNRKTAVAALEQAISAWE